MKHNPKEYLPLINYLAETNVMKFVPIFVDTTVESYDEELDNLHRMAVITIKPNNTLSIHKELC